MRTTTPIQPSHPLDAKPQHQAPRTSHALQRTPCSPSAATQRMPGPLLHTPLLWHQGRRDATFSPSRPRGEGWERTADTTTETPLVSTTASPWLPVGCQYALLPLYCCPHQNSSTPGSCRALENPLPPLTHCYILATASQKWPQAPTASRHVWASTWHSESLPWPPNCPQRSP